MLKIYPHLFYPSNNISASKVIFLRVCLIGAKYVVLSYNLESRFFTITISNSQSVFSAILPKNLDNQLPEKSKSKSLLTAATSLGICI